MLAPTNNSNPFVAAPGWRLSSSIQAPDYQKLCAPFRSQDASINQRKREPKGKQHDGFLLSRDLYLGITKDTFMPTETVGDSLSPKDTCWIWGPIFVFYNQHDEDYQSHRGPESLPIVNRIRELRELLDFFVWANVREHNGALLCMGPSRHRLRHDAVGPNQQSPAQ